MEKRPEKHDNCPGPFGRGDVHVFEFEASWWHDFEVAIVANPACFYADAVEYLDDTVDLFDTSDTTKGCRAFVEQSGTEKAYGCVFAGLGFNLTVEFIAAMDSEAHFAAVVEHDDIAVQLVTDPLEHLDTQVLTTFFYPINGTL